MSTKGYVITFLCLVMLVILMGTALIPIFEDNNGPSVSYRTDGTTISVGQNTDTLIMASNAVMIQGLYNGTADVGDYTVTYDTVGTKWALKDGAVTKATYTGNQVRIGYMDGNIYFNSDIFPSESFDRIRAITPTGWMSNSYTSYTLTATEADVPIPTYMTSPIPTVTTYPTISWGTSDGMKVKAIADGLFEVGSYFIGYTAATTTWTVFDADMTEVDTIIGDIQNIGWKEGYLFIGQSHYAESVKPTGLTGISNGMFENAYYLDTITVSHAKAVTPTWTAGDHSYITIGGDSITFTANAAQITATKNSQSVFGDYGMTYNAVTSAWTFYSLSEPSVALATATGATVDISYKNGELTFNENTIPTDTKIYGLDCITSGSLGTTAVSETVTVYVPNAYVNVFVLLAIISFLAFAVMIPAKWI